MAKKTKAKGKGGRPTKFDKSMIERALELAKQGKTNEEIADVFGVSESTFYLWLKKQSEFSEVLKKGKAAADDMVEVSLFKRATGFTVPETKVFVNNLGIVTKVDVVKHHAPDVTAAIFWLKNRRPDDWKDRKETKVEIGHLDKLPAERVIELGREAIRFLEEGEADE